MPESIPKATHEGSIDFGFGSAPCAVLDNGLRILSQAAFLELIGRNLRPPKRGREVFDKLPSFLGAKNLQPFIGKDLRCSTNSIEYKPLKGGGLKGNALGYIADLLPGVCKVYWDAKRAGVLRENQKHIAERCEEILVALINVAIIALIDEATGYQEVRPKNELQSLLEMYLLKSADPWKKKFTDEFYEEIHRLKGWVYNPPYRSPRVGTITIDIVYRRIQPDLWEELLTKNLDKKKYRYHQFLTENIGNIHLRSHLREITRLMAGCQTWGQFMVLLNRLYPVHNLQMDIFFDLLTQSPEDFDRWNHLVS